MRMESRRRTGPRYDAMARWQALSGPRKAVTRPSQTDVGTGLRWARIERTWWLALGGDNACILGFPDRQPVPGAGDQRLRPLVSGRRGGAPGPGHLSAARDEPALPVHVSARCCRNACVGEPARASRVTVGAPAGKLGCRGWLASCCRSGWRPVLGCNVILWS